MVANLNPLVSAEIVESAMKVSHIEELLTSLAPAQRLLQYEGCDFFVQEYPDAHLIQGDNPLLFFKSDKSGFTPLLTGAEDFLYAFLPLGPTKVLFASKGERPSHWEELRQASAACSREHFIAGASLPELNELKSTIGSCALIFTDSDIALIFDEVIKESLSFDFVRCKDADLALSFLNLPTVAKELEPNVKSGS